MKVLKFGLFLNQTRITQKYKNTTANKRFGVSRGVCSRRVLREFESLSPVRALASPRPNAKPPTVGGHAATERKRNY